MGTAAPQRLQTTHPCNETMSKEVLISMLRQGKTGEEIISILDAIVADTVDCSPMNDPTLDEIEF